MRGAIGTFRMISRSFLVDALALLARYSRVARGLVSPCSCVPCSRIACALLASYASERWANACAARLPQRALSVRCFCMSAWATKALPDCMAMLMHLRMCVSHCLSEQSVVWEARVTQERLPFVAETANKDHHLPAVRGSDLVGELVLEEGGVAAGIERGGQHSSGLSSRAG